MAGATGRGSGKSGYDLYQVTFFEEVLNNVVESKEPSRQRVEYSLLNVLEVTQCLRERCD
jgi:hypothetical protein